MLRLVLVLRASFACFMCNKETQLASQCDASRIIAATRKVYELLLFTEYGLFSFISLWGAFNSHIIYPLVVFFLARNGCCCCLCYWLLLLLLLQPAPAPAFIRLRCFYSDFELFIQYDILFLAALIFYHDKILRMPYGLCACCWWILVISVGHSYFASISRRFQIQQHLIWALIIIFCFGMCC